MDRGLIDIQLILPILPTGINLTALYDGTIKTILLYSSQIASSQRKIDPCGNELP